MKFKKSDSTAAAKKTNGLGYWFVQLFLKKPLGALGLIIMVILILMAVFANYLAPEGYNAINTKVILQAPSSHYPLGTDNVGRSILTRIIYGARLSIFVGLAATTILTVISTVLGTLSAYIGGKFDLLFQRFIDAYSCFPDLPLLIMIMSLLGPGIPQILLVLGVNSGIQATRSTRALAFMVKENQYFYASEALGARTWWIIRKHMIPNILPLIIVTFSTRMAGVILAEASLSFLGLGLPDPLPSWGKMISGPGRSFMLSAPWMLFFPGLALTIAVFGINVFGDALRDLLDPRLRGGLGGYSVSRAEKARRKLISSLNIKA